RARVWKRELHGEAPVGLFRAAPAGRRAAARISAAGPGRDAAALGGVTGEGIRPRPDRMDRGRYTTVRRPLSRPTRKSTIATTRSTCTNAPIVYVPTMPSSQAISRMTA